MFILISRCAGEVPKQYATRFLQAKEQFESQHESYTEIPIANGFMMIARNGDALYLNTREL